MSMSKVKVELSKKLGVLLVALALLYVLIDFQYRLFIRNNGEVLPCCHWFSMEHPVGNIYENSIKDIWMGEKMRRFRSGVNAKLERQPEVCRRCRKSSLPQDYPYEWKPEPLEEAM